MRIVQWNTHHGGKRSDGILDTPGLGAALAKFTPDLVCLNEVEQFDGYGNHDAVGIWCTALGPGWTGVFANLSGVLGGHGQGNAILIGPGHVVTAPPRSCPLYGSRVALAVEVDHVMVVATHLDDGTDAGSQAMRATEIAQLWAWDPVHTSAQLILAGDWNATPGALELAPLRILLVDAWAACAKLGLASSFNGTGNTRGSRIDAVFTRKLTPRHCDVPDTRTPAGVTPSDHFPVVVDL
jgi:endonuclease/exonuclease/phosphatase family metal-dependent hydrolase